MALLEGEHQVHGGGKVREFLEAGGRVVAMAAVVDLAALDHEEEALVGEMALEIVDAGPDEVGQGGVVFPAVDGIRQVRFLLAAQADDPAFDGSHALEDGAMEDVDAGVPCLLLEVGAGALGILIHQETGARREVHRGLNELGSDGIVVPALFRMGVETGRRSVVDTHRRDNAHARTRLMRPVGDGRNRQGIGIDADGAVVGLHARGERRSAGCGIRHQRRGGHRRHEATDREMGEIDLGRAGPVRSIVLFCSHDLVDAHAVTDHVENIFDFRLRLPAAGAQYGRQSQGQDKLKRLFHVVFIIFLTNKNKQKTEHFLGLGGLFSIFVCKVLSRHAFKDEFFNEMDNEKDPSLPLRLPSRSGLL